MAKHPTIEIRRLQGTRRERVADVFFPGGQYVTVRARDNGGAPTLDVGDGIRGSVRVQTKASDALRDLIEAIYPRLDPDAEFDADTQVRVSEVLARYGLGARRYEAGDRAHCWRCGKAIEAVDLETTDGEGPHWVSVPGKAYDDCEPDENGLRVHTAAVVSRVD